MKITTLIENTLAAGPPLVAENGLSLFVAHAGGALLFDTGLAGHLVDNARHLGVDLASVDAAVISHHHFDHGGGLEDFFEVNARAPVFLRRAAWGRYLFRLAGPLHKDVGLDPVVLETHRARLRFLEQDTEIVPNVFALTEFPSNHPAPRGNERLWVERDGTRQRDTFDHELALAIREGDGLVVFTGCSHHGVLNMLDAVERRFPGSRIKAVFGGLHLISLPFFETMSASVAEVETLASALLARPVDRYFSGHCTGRKGFAALAKVMGSRIAPLGTGAVVDV